MSTDSSSKSGLLAPPPKNETNITQNYIQPPTRAHNVPEKNGAHVQSQSLPKSRPGERCLVKDFFPFPPSPMPNATGATSSSEVPRGLQLGVTLANPDRSCPQSEGNAWIHSQGGLVPYRLKSSIYEICGYATTLPAKRFSLPISGLSWRISRFK